MTCTCGRGFCSEHPKCPWCHNEVTVFASGHREFRCTRCKKVFTKRTVVVTQPLQSLINETNNREAKTMKNTNIAKSTKSVNVNRKSEEKIMAKKSAKKVVAKKSVAIESRESNLEYKFVKPLSEDDAPNPETAFGCVYVGARKQKSGTLDEMRDAAVKAGLAKVSNQDLTVITRKALRQFANAGAFRVMLNGEEKNGNGPAVKKAKKAAKGKKSFKLVKK